MFRKRRAGPLIWGRRILLVTIGLALVWAAGLVRFSEHAAEFSRVATADASPTDAIVVLTGGSGRLSSGFELLHDGHAKKLFISGVYRGVEVQELLAVARRSDGDIHCCVDLGYEARTTRGNASETASWMAKEGFRSLRLVTANYHMPRSLLEFRAALPETEIVSHAVSPETVHLERWWRWPGTAALLVDEYNKYLVALARTWVERAWRGLGSLQHSEEAVVRLAGGPTTTDDPSRP